MVDPEEHPGAIQPAYMVSAPVASPYAAANPDPINNRVDVLEKALRLVQGANLQPHLFRDLCYFPEAVLPSMFKIPDFEKYNGRGCLLAHLKAYCRDLAQLQANERLLICLFQKSLTGPVLKWFTSLDMAVIKTSVT